MARRYYPPYGSARDFLIFCERPGYPCGVRPPLPIENALYRIAGNVADKRGIKRLAYYAEFSDGGHTTTIENYIAAPVPKVKLVLFRSLMKILGDAADLDLLSAGEVEDLVYQWIERHAQEGQDRIALRSALRRAQDAKAKGDHRDARLMLLAGRGFQLLPQASPVHSSWLYVEISKNLLCTTQCSVR